MVLPVHEFMSPHLCLITPHLLLFSLITFYVFISFEFPLSLCPFTRLLCCVACIMFIKTYSSYLKSPASFLHDTTLTDEWTRNRDVCGAFFPLFVFPVFKVFCLLLFFPPPTSWVSPPTAAPLARRSREICRHSWEIGTAAPAAHPCPLFTGDHRRRPRLTKPAVCGKSAAVPGCQKSAAIHGHRKPTYRCSCSPGLVGGI